MASASGTKPSGPGILGWMGGMISSRDGLEAGTRPVGDRGESGEGALQKPCGWW